MPDATPDINPYQPPQSVLVPVKSNPGAYRVDVHRGSLHGFSYVVLPEICIKSGLPLSAASEPKTRITRKVYFCPPWAYLGVLVNILLYILLYFVFRKPCEVTYSIALSERRKLVRRKIFGYLGLFGGIFAVGIGASLLEQPQGWAILIPGAGLIIWSFVLLFRSNALRATGRQNQEFVIHGIPRKVIGQFVPGAE